MLFESAPALEDIFLKDNSYLQQPLLFLVNQNFLAKWKKFRLCTRNRSPRLRSNCWMHTRIASMFSESQQSCIMKVTNSCDGNGRSSLFFVLEPTERLHLKNRVYFWKHFQTNVIDKEASSWQASVLSGDMFKQLLTKITIIRLLFEIKRFSPLIWHWTWQWPDGGKSSVF